MRYTVTHEICDVCGKRFSGIPINVHGSYDYIRHTNFSNNIGTLFCWTEDIPRNRRARAIVKEFFKDGNDKISKADAIEFLECFKHYKYEKYADTDLMNEVFEEIQRKIDKMK